MESPEFGGEVQHVLENPLVLKQIFNFLAPTASLQLLQNVRLVSRTWHRESLNLWRKTALLSLQETSLFTQPGTQGVSPARYLEELQTSDSPFQLREKPFHRFKLHKLKINLGFCTTNEKALDFWTLVGPQIRHLTLSSVKFDAGTPTRLSSEQVLMHFLCSKLPNLESVFLEGVDIRRLPSPEVMDTPEVVPDFDGGLEQLIHRKVTQLSFDGALDLQVAHFPVLEKLAINFMVSLEFCLAPLGTFDLHHYEPQILENETVKHLDLLNCVAVSCSTRLRFPALEQLRVAVESFREIPEREEEDPNVLKNLLRDSAAKLTNLEAFNNVTIAPTREGIFHVDFPHMTQLKMCGNVAWDLNFLRLMPHLQVLHVDYYGFTRRDMMRQRIENWEPVHALPLIRNDPVKQTVESKLMIGVVMEKLEKLSINYCLEPESVRVLAGWMPKLKKFRGVFTGETLKIVGEVWREQLEDLRCLYRSRIEDTDIFEIKGMTRLRRFRYDAECRISLLTDECVTQGFLQMERLSDLEICVSEKFSPESETALQKNIQDVRVIRNYVANPLHQNWPCCWDAAFKHLVFEYESIAQRGEQGSLSPSGSPSSPMQFFTSSSSDDSSDEHEEGELFVDYHGYR